MIPAMVRQSVRALIISGMVVSVVGCSFEEGSRPRRPASRKGQDISATSPAEPMPWEIWRPFYDSTGTKLTNGSLLLGDEMLRKGKRRSALEAYLQAQKTKLSDAEAEAAAVRTASQYLALDESARALSTVSQYFKSRGLGENDVPTSFSLLLAYAYGRHGDTEQSLAWFSKANRQAQQGERTGVQASETGTTLLLRTIPQKDFETVALDWSSDPFINELVGRERLRRSSPGYREYTELRRPFWEGATQSLVANDLPTSEVVGNGQPAVVGVILSLSDKFGSLGRDTRQGFDLAVEADRETPRARVEVRDVGSDSSAASAAVRELVATSSPAVIVGPLLTDVSVAAADTARELRTPLLSFSKSESFPTGNGITRLGATTTSQMDALVTAAHKDYGITQFAIAYPESANGNEVLHVFKKRLASYGLTPVLEAPYVASDEASMMEVAQRLDSAGAQAVLIPDSIEMSVKLLSNVSPSTRKTMRPLGTALWDNPSKIANSQALFDSAIFVTPFFPQSSRPVVQQFNESYKGKFKVAPNFLAAQGFDAGTLVVSAIHKAARERKSFPEALASLPRYEGVTGLIEMTPGGEIRRSFYVVEVSKNGFLEHFPGTGGVNAAPPAAGSSSAPVRTGPSFLKEEERVESGY
jgi:branched-chain amino acid transport system substrate-binding protein